MTYDLPGPKKTPPSWLPFVIVVVLLVIGWVVWQYGVLLP